MSLQDLFDNEDVVVSHMGGTVPGVRAVFRGKDLHHELSHLNWMEIFVLGITGRILSKEQIKLLFYVWESSAYIDPRVWPVRLNSLAGTVRSTPTIGLAAGMAACDARLYGHLPSIRAIDLFLRAKEAVDAGTPLDEFVQEEITLYRTIYGYGRPVSRIDERIPHMKRIIAELGFADDPYIKIAFDIEKVMMEKKGFNLNAGGLGGAMGAAAGLSPVEYLNFMVPCFIGGMLPCFMEAEQKQEATFLPLRCTRVEYEGPQPRPWDDTTS